MTALIRNTHRSSHLLRASLSPRDKHRLRNSWGGDIKGMHSNSKIKKLCIPPYIYMVQQAEQYGTYLASQHDCINKGKTP